MIDKLFLKAKKTFKPFNEFFLQLYYQKMNPGLDALYILIRVFSLSLWDEIFNWNCFEMVSQLFFYGCKFVFVGENT